MRWQTPDPLGFEAGFNLYAFVKNNPLRYYDPDGQNPAALVIPLFEITFGAAGTAFILPTLPILCAAVTVGALGYSVYKINEYVDNIYLKDEVGYAPDRPLPKDENGVFIPDTDAPHTQLGTREGRRGRYRQAREFDENGKPVRDIDFTDHGKPHQHTNPHQHRREENDTGGTKTRENPEPLAGWNY